MRLLLPRPTVPSRETDFLTVRLLLQQQRAEKILAPVLQRPLSHLHPVRCWPERAAPLLEKPPRAQRACECLPGSARQCLGRAASSRSPSSSGLSGGSGGTSWDAAAGGHLTPGQRAAPQPARRSPPARSGPLRPRAAGPVSLGPWGFASCRAMSTLHTSRPLPRSAPRRGAQLSAPRSSPGISSHGPSAGRRDSLVRAAAPGPGSEEPGLHRRRGRGRMEPRRERAEVPTVPVAARRRARGSEGGMGAARSPHAWAGSRGQRGEAASRGGPRSQGALGTLSAYVGCCLSAQLSLARARTRTPAPAWAPARFPALVPGPRVLLQLRAAPH